MQCWQVDALTDRPFSGNPAAVFIRKQDISDELKHKLENLISRLTKRLKGRGMLEIQITSDRIRITGKAITIFNATLLNY